MDYRCKGCRRRLFDDRVVSHRCSSVFVDEPLEWMRIAGHRGKLACTCGAKLGSWDWGGVACQCGEWIVPAFQIAASRVDARRRRIPPAKPASGLIDWLRTQPPPCAVVCVAEAKQIEGRWLGRRREGRAAWVYARDLALLDELEDRGVPRERVAVGALGDAAPDVARDAVLAGVLVVFAVAPATPRLRDALNLACDRGAAVLAIFDTHDPHLDPRATLSVFLRLDVDDLAPGVVRTVVTWLHDTLPGHKPPDPLPDRCVFTDTTTSTPPPHHCAAATT